MLQFIVLGYVPGTSIQLNFANYLLMVVFVVLIFGCYWYVRTKTMRHLAQQALLSMISI